MATIDEIFAAMPEEAAETGREYLVIDPETRSITVPESERIFGVTGDALADRKYFICPRYVGDGLDLAGMFLTVYFRTATEYEDGYLVDDVAVNGEYVTFSWLLSSSVTEYKGTVQFTVCADLPNTAEKRRPDWNTTTASGEVLEGLDPDVGDVVAETSDVVAQLREMVTAQTAAVETTGAAQVKNVQTEGSTQVDTVKATGAQTEADALAAIKAQGEATLASIPAEYTAMANQVDKLTRDRAAAIVCQAEGELLQITDAGNDPLQGLRIFGRTEQVKTTGAQLLPITDAATKTDRGLTQTIVGGVCTVRGTANSTAAFNLTLYGAYSNTAPVFKLQPGTYTARDCMIVSSDGITQKKYENTFTLTEELGVTWVATRSYQPGEVVAEVTHPMLNTGTTALPWEPYSGGVASPSPAWPQNLQSVKAPAVGVCGKNLIPNIISKTAGGVTFTANPDGSFTVNGTADAYRNSDSEPLDATPYRGKTVTLSGKHEFSANLALQIYSKCKSGNVFNSITRGKVNTFKIPDDAITISLQCYITNGKTAENVVIYPQLELGDKETDFEPYQAQTMTVTTPGSLPGIPVASGGNYTDANGQEWVCDEVDLARGVYVQRVKEVTITAAPAFNETADQPGRFAWYCLTGEFKSGREVALCNYAKWRAWGITDGTAEHGAISINQIYYSPVVAMTADEVNAKFAKMIEDGTPPTILGQLETPVETHLSDVELQAFLAMRSNKPTTTVLNDAGAHMVLEYAADPKTYIDNKLAALVAANT